MALEIIGIELYFPVPLHASVEAPSEAGSAELSPEKINAGFSNEEPCECGNEEFEEGNLLSHHEIEGEEGRDLALDDDADADNHLGPLGMSKGQRA